MVSKMVNDRDKMVEALVGWDNVHQPAVRAGLKQNLGPRVEVEPLMEAAMGGVVARRDRLVQADEKNIQEQADDNEPRRTRTLAVIQITDILSGAKAAVEVGYGAEHLPLVGLGEPLPTDPHALGRVATRFQATVTKRGFELPTPKRKRVRVDLKEFAEELDAWVPTLLGALEQLHTEEGELQETQKIKKEAMESFDRFYSDATNLFYYLAVLAGEKDRGEKIPSPPRHRRRFPGEEEEVIPGGGEGGPEA